MADFDKKHATKDAYGNITAKNQHGIDAKARPRKSWRFGDDLFADSVTPTKIK